jgi:hypothetical protein
MLIVHTLFGDVDKMTDTFIAKSAAYTITGPLIVLAALNRQTMRFVPNLTNNVEFDVAVIPANITPDQIHTLNDVITLGGNLLGSAIQGIPVLLPTKPETSH